MRERKKREQKILAELGNLEPKEERRVFKARPMPKYVYSSTQRQRLHSFCGFMRALKKLVKNYEKPQSLRKTEGTNARS